MDQNALLEYLLNKLPIDGYAPIMEFDWVYNGDDRKAVADKLVGMGCLEPGWKAVGKNKIQGQFNIQKIKRLLDS